MTLKQDEFLKRLPKNGYNMAETMREVGYSAQSSRAGSLYASLRAKMAKLYDPEVIKSKIIKYEKLFTKKEDHSNLARMVELQAKIAGLTKDTANTQVTAVFNSELIKELPRIKVNDIEVNNTQTPETTTDTDTKDTAI